MMESVDRRAGVMRNFDVPLPRPIPRTIRGWMFAYELRWLYNRAEQLRGQGVLGGVLEVGSYKGLSASALGQSGPLTCVDTFLGGEDLPDYNSRGEFDAAMRTMGLSPRVLVGRSADVLGDLVRAGEKFRLVLIDGSHEYANVKADLALGHALLAVGGSLVADDYIGFPEVARACDETGYGFLPVHPQRSKMAVATRT